MIKNEFKNSLQGAFFSISNYQSNLLKKDINFIELNNSLELLNDINSKLDNFINTYKINSISTLYELLELLPIKYCNNDNLYNMSINNLINLSNFLKLLDININIDIFYRMLLVKFNEIHQNFVDNFESRTFESFDLSLLKQSFYLFRDINNISLIDFFSSFNITNLVKGDFLPHSIKDLQDLYINCNNIIINLNVEDC